MALAHHRVLSLVALLCFLVSCLAGDCDVFAACATLQGLVPASAVDNNACCATPFAACRNTTGGSRVVSLTINGGRLRGPLCSQFAHLTLLERLDLSGNALTGDLQVLSNLQMLSYLDLSFNGDLSGTVAPLAALTRLQFLSLAGCSMRGTPFSFCALPLCCRHGQFMHAFPSRSLTFSVCPTGTLDTLAPLTALTTLRLFNNNFDGTATGLSGMTVLTTLRVAGNPNLGGSLQPFARLHALTWLSIANCAFSGKLSPLANLTNLLYLIAGNNRLQDSLVALATLSSLRSLDLSNNYMYGTLAPLAPTCSTLSGVVMLDNNRLSGDLSPLAACVNVATLSVQRNALVGNISHMARYRSVTSLALGYNQFEGPVDTLRFLTSLKSLVLSANRFTGSIDAVAVCLRLGHLFESVYLVTQVSDSRPSLS
jgi:Leucine-rich repeat (LRR) protein